MLGVRIKHLARSAPDVAGSIAFYRGVFPALEAFSAFALFSPIEVMLLLSMITTIVASINYETYVTGCINHIFEFQSR